MEDFFFAFTGKQFHVLCIWIMSGFSKECSQHQLQEAILYNPKSQFFQYLLCLQIKSSTSIQFFSSPSADFGILGDQHFLVLEENRLALHSFKGRMTIKRKYSFFLGVMKCSKNCGNGYTTCKYIKNHYTAHFKWMNFTAYDFYISVELLIKKRLKKILSATLETEFQTIGIISMMYFPISCIHVRLNFFL